MSEALYAAASGIRANQTWLDVISNNVANANTVGFKSSSANFATVFAQTITGGSPPTGTIGGTNPEQQGNGVYVSEIPANFSQGGTEYTGKSTDLMINGSGFFAIQDNNTNGGSVNTSYYLTRAGNFSMDSSGNLVTVSGNRVLGTSQVSGTGPTTQSTVNVPQQMLIIKDLDVNNNVVGVHFAQLGAAANNPGGPIYYTAAGSGITLGAGTTSQSVAQVKLSNFTIGSDGAITATYSNGDRIAVRTDQSTVSLTNPAAARRQIIEMPAEGGTFAALNQVATDSGAVDQVAGSPVFTAPPGGVALQGMQMQIQSATVTNPQGLLYDSSNNFLPGANSGNTFFGVPSSENRGSLQAGSLESSNVDIATQFTNMVVAQQGLQASSKVISIQNQVMQSILQSV